MVPSRINRRTFSVAAASLALLPLAGCDSEPKPSSTATLLNNEKVHAAILEIDGAISSLEEDVERFDSDEWREVVPEVKSSTEELRSALDSLRTALGYPT